jgi:hypothetical protein
MRLAMLPTIHIEIEPMSEQDHFLGQPFSLLRRWAIVYRLPSQYYNGRSIRIVVRYSDNTFSI